MSENDTTLAVRLPADLHAELVAAAVMADRSVSWVVRDAIRRLVEENAGNPPASE